MKKLIALISSLAAAPALAAVIVGGNVDVEQPVDGSLYVAGGDVNISAPISGNLRVAGGDVKIKGPVAGKVAVAGGHVQIDSSVGGNATVSGGQLELGPNARINGKLNFNGGHLEQDPAAQVVGGIVRSERHRHGWNGGWNGDHHVGKGIGRAVWITGLMLLAAIIAGAMPGPVRRMETELRTRPWLATLFGVVALICIPIAAVIVMITIIGIPLGVLGIIGYVALLLIGYVMTSVVVSGMLLGRYKAEAASQTAWRVGAAVLAMLVIASARYVPYVGGFIGLVALVVGVGVIVAAIVHRRQEATPQSTAAI